MACSMPRLAVEGQSGDAKAISDEQAESRLERGRARVRVGPDPGPLWHALLARGASCANRRVGRTGFGLGLKRITASIFAPGHVPPETIACVMPRRATPAGPAIV